MMNRINYNISSHILTSPQDEAGRSPSREKSEIRIDYLVNTKPFRLFPFP